MDGNVKDWPFAASSVINDHIGEPEKELINGIYGTLITANLERRTKRKLKFDKK